MDMTVLALKGSSGLHLIGAGYSDSVVRVSTLYSLERTRAFAFC